jgi:diphosphomevalonate decarboxylase
VSRATAVAHANIALVKYWGKRDEALHLPQAPSLSIALDRLSTTTTVELGAESDSLILDGKQATPAELGRARALLDAAGIPEGARIESRNTFPTAAGLASSASGFAALAVAACAAAGQRRTERELSALARRGSGSATRSVPGGWAAWQDEFAEQVAAPGHLPVRAVIAVCGEGHKAVGSRDGMKQTRDTSPFHAAYIAQCRRDFGMALQLLRDRDLPRLCELAERNALRMHADALAADPAVVYWEAPTISCLHAVRRLREAGTAAWATIDAGPHLIALCAPAQAKAVEAELRSIDGVRDVLVCGPAGGARVVEGPPSHIGEPRRAEHGEDDLP